MVGQADTGPRVGPLMVKLRDPTRAEAVARELNVMGNGQWRAWTRNELAEANAAGMFEEGILVIIIGGCVVLGTIIGVAITWQTLRGAIMAKGGRPVVVTPPPALPAGAGSDRCCAAPR